ncbi:MAG: acetate--CoA ligase family protein [Syntrophales bacterium]|nr:acetate--CoA ligase family protein [Syntrophales bacterium]
MEVMERALKRGQTILSEYQSKKLLAGYGIPVTRENLVNSEEEAVRAAREIGFPVALKGCSPEATHKTELKLIELNLRDQTSVVEAYRKIMNNAGGVPLDGVLVQEMIEGERELVVGMTRDVQFGPCVMFGLGGIFTEILNDVSFRVAPLERRDALEMMGEIKGHRILEAIRGLEAADKEAFCDILIKVGQIGLDFEQIKEIDINPLIIHGNQPVAVDALVVLG